MLLSWGFWSPIFFQLLAQRVNLRPAAQLKLHPARASPPLYFQFFSLTRPLQSIQPNPILHCSDGMPWLVIWPNINHNAIGVGVKVSFLSSDFCPFQPILQKMSAFSASLSIKDYTVYLLSTFNDLIDCPCLRWFSNFEHENNERKIQDNKLASLEATLVRNSAQRKMLSFCRARGKSKKKQALC